MKCAPCSASHVPEDCADRVRPMCRRECSCPCGRDELSAAPSSQTAVND